VTEAVAHRGDPYHHRENTLPSVRSALLKDADVVEVDVRLTSAGEPVLLHDPTLERLWGSPDPVTSLTSDALFKLTDGQVPSLADALAELAGHERGRMLLDLTEPAQAAPALAAARESALGDRVYYCGGPAAMRELRGLDQDVEIALTWTTSALPGKGLLAEIQPRWLNLRFGLIDAPLVAWCHGRHLKVAAWTADWERSMGRLARLGVDAVTSNRLTALQRVLRADAARRARRTGR
jgi:glycerophosphoryl diester phosphodiesterase